MDFWLEFHFMVLVVGRQYLIQYNRMSTTSVHTDCLQSLQIANPCLQPLWTRLSPDSADIKSCLPSPTVEWFCDVICQWTNVYRSCRCREREREREKFYRFWTFLLHQLWQYVFTAGPLERAPHVLDAPLVRNSLLIFGIPWNFGTTWNFWCPGRPYGHACPDFTYRWLRRKTSAGFIAQGYPSSDRTWGKQTSCTSPLLCENARYQQTWGDTSLGRSRFCNFTLARALNTGPASRPGQLWLLHI